MARADTPVRSVATADSLTPDDSRNFSSRCTMRTLSRAAIDLARVRSRKSRTGSGRASDVAADAVQGEGDRSAAGSRPNGVRPSRHAVVDRGRCPERRYGRYLGRPAGDTDDGRTGGSQRLHEDRADTARGGGDED